MPITMQGNWTVSVKSKNASYKQRFVIQGSDAADGIYAGETTTPAVNVTGAQWSITIEHLPKGRGASWQTSSDRLGSPSRSGGQILFDIMSNDSGADEDYNDLILTCSTIESASEYVVYGKVRSYSGFCLYNPCFPRHIVIDTPRQLREVLKHASIRETLEKLYPERIREFGKRPPIPDPEPDPLAFRPMMIPLGMELPETGQAIERVTAHRPGGTRAYLPDLLKFKDKFKLRCKVEDQPGLLLRFIEYDRTASELGGGAYTGTGDREVLGLAVTDEQGNYIFRFSWTLEDIAEEFEDVPSGSSSPATELRPDLIVQIVSGIGDGPDFLFETALLANIPNLKRVNLCVPADAIQPGPTACQGGRAIQSIGNIWTLPGVGNSFDSAGRITATNPTGPLVTRGAWRGRLDLFACFIDQPQVKFYTIRFRRPGGEWSFVEQPYTHIKISEIGTPNYKGTKVGPFTAVQMRVDGGPPRTVPYYLNIELDPAWVIAKRTRKIQLRSATYENLLYAPEEDPRTVEFRIDGYDKDGNKVAGAEDSIRLYLDNRRITGDIKGITMGGEPATECALFELPAANTPLTIKFRVQQAGGFVQSYSLNVLRGSATPVAVHDVVAPVQPLSVTYSEATHGDTLFGTANGVNPDLEDYVTAELQATAGAWLPTGKQFCAFAFEIHASPRVTNGYGLYGSRRLDVELVGISHTPPPTT